jgi:hypothetical protein
MARFRVRLVRDNPVAPPDYYTFTDPETGETRTMTRDEMIAYVTLLINEGKLEIES